MTYIVSGFNNPSILLLPGQLGYSFGSLSDRIPATSLAISSVTIDGSDNATYTVKVLSGNIPAINSLLSVQGVVLDSNLFNVANAVITNVTIDAVTGIGTVVVTISHGAVSPTAVAGLGTVPVPEVADTLTQGVAGQQFALGNFTGLNENGVTVAWETEYPSAPDTVTMNLEAALRDVDAEYQVLDTSSNAGGELRYIQNVRFNFLRIKCFATSGGTLPTIIAKMVV